MQTITVFDQITLTKEELMSTQIMDLMKDLQVETSNPYLKYRLEFVLQKWRAVLQNKPLKMRKSRSAVSTSVFEAIITDDEQFFETTSVPELLHRLLKSFDKDYKVKKLYYLFEFLVCFS